MTVPPPSGLSLVTPSYRGDLERFRRLADSVNALCGPEVEHLVLVPAADLDAFAPLCGPRQRLMDSRAAVPARFWRLPKALNPLRTGRDVWLRPDCLPVRGWIMQQIVKIGAARVARHDTLVYADSDTTVLRPLNAARLHGPDGRLRLFHEAGVTGHLAAHRKWYATIARLLGVPQERFFGDNYVGDFVTWRRANVAALIAHLERGGRPWWWRLANSLHFSEYMLYGVFCDHVLGEAAAGHRRDAGHVCLASWGHDLTTEAGIAAYVAALRPDQVACSVQSQEPLSIAARDAIIDRLIARARAQDGEGG